MERAHAEDFERALRDLTFNSRALIQSLTMIAATAPPGAHPALARTAVAHVASAPAAHKVPALFLVDSLAKSVGGTMRDTLRAALPDVFAASYASLRDERARCDFERTLRAWEVGDVFPADFVASLRRSMSSKASLGDSAEKRSADEPLDPRDPRRSRPPAPRTQPTLHTSFAPRPVPLHIAGMLLSLRQLTAVPAAQYRGRDVAALMGALRAECASAGLPDLFAAADERARLSDKHALLSLIDGVLATAHSAAHNLNESVPGVRPPVPGVPQYAPVNSQSYGLQYGLAFAPMPGSSAPPAAPYGAAVGHQPQGVPQYAAAEGAHAGERSPSLGDLVLPQDLTPLLQSLSSMIPLAVSRENAEIFALFAPDAVRRVERDAHRVLYGALPRQCTACGFRFADTTSGRAALQTHLDEHYRRNVRVRDTGRRVLARLWMQKESDWVNAVANVDESPAALFAPDAGRAGADAPAGETIAVPQGAAGMACAVCRERLEEHWDRDFDAWVFRSVLRRRSDDAIVHAHCSTDA